MSKEIGGAREPMDKGTVVDGMIDSPMCDKNVGLKSDRGGTHIYKDMPSGDKGGVSIEGPGVKGQWKK